MDPLRIAVLGCGAVTELAHLPAAGRLEHGRVTLLVDTNPVRLEKLSREFNVPRTAADCRPHLDEFDAAIVALPHSLHAEACCFLLEHGKAVLVEKPLADTEAGANRIIAAAEAAGALLAVGLMRRLQWSHRLAREMLSSGVIGAVRRFDFREGNIYNWPVASDFFFRKEASGGGVLADTGAHTLDSLVWWLGEPERIEYFDDAAGGVEANCLLRLGMPGGAEGTVELSRTRRLRNTAVIEGERGFIEVGMGGNSFRLGLAGSDYAIKGDAFLRSAPARPQDYFDLMVEQLTLWCEAVRLGRPPNVSGAEALRSLKIIESCYNKKQPLDVPWEAASGGLHA